jgi:hypothetical protein
MTPKSRARLTAEKRRELMVTAAVAREALLQMHVTRAVKLIELSGNRVSVMRMLSIYARVQELSKADDETISNRVLALLGNRRKGQNAPAAVYVEGEEENPGVNRSLFGSMRDRMKGRRFHDLRRWVELHTGSTQAALIEIHVRHALRFVYELNETHAVVDALEVYRELVEVPDNLTDALYIYVLDRLAAEELPKSQKEEVPADPAQVSLFPGERRRNKRAV